MKFARSGELSDDYEKKKQEMQKAEDGLLTVSQPIMCRSEIDGYGYTQDSEGIRL